MWHVWEERWIAYTVCLTVGLIAIGWGVKYIIKSVLATVKMMHSNCALPSCTEPAGSSDGGWGGAPPAFSPGRCPAVMVGCWHVGLWEAGLALMALPKPGSTSWTPTSLWHESSAFSASDPSLRWGLQKPEGSEPVLGCPGHCSMMTAALCWRQLSFTWFQLLPFFKGLCSADSGFACFWRLLCKWQPCKWPRCAHTGTRGKFPGAGTLWIW